MRKKTKTHAAIYVCFQSIPDLESKFGQWAKFTYTHTEKYTQTHR